MLVSPILLLRATRAISARAQLCWCFVLPIDVLVLVSVCAQTSVEDTKIYGHFPGT